MGCRESRTQVLANGGHAKDRKQERGQHGANLKAIDTISTVTANTIINELDKGVKSNATTSGRSTSNAEPPKSGENVPPAGYTAPFPMEIVELIIDNVDDGSTFLACSLVCRDWLARCRYYFFSRISTPAASCAGLLQILEPSKLMAHRTPNIKRSTLPPAGIFVQSLVVTSSADYLLSPVFSADPRHNPTLAAELLLECVPNVKELQLIGVTQWALTHFLDPLSKIAKLDEIALLDLRCGSWIDVASSLVACAPTLKSLRIAGLRFRAPRNVEDKDGVLKIVTPSAAAAAAAMARPDLCFPLLKRLLIGMEREDSAFTIELLNSLVKGPSGSLEHLEVLELQLHAASQSQRFLSRLGGSLKSLTIHCERTPAGQDTSGIKSHPLNLKNLSRLETLHFSVQALWDYERLALVSLRTLVDCLSGFPYSTLITLRFTYRSGHFRPPYNTSQWKELDDTLSMPHLVGLERLELDGLSGAVASVRRGLPNSCARGIVKFLW